jgi:hypothetical protein
MRGWRIISFIFISVVMAGVMSGAARSSDPLRLSDGFRLLQLTPYMTRKISDQSAGQVFAIQNSGSRELELVLQRAPLSDLAVALRLQSASRPALRLFSSGDNEFAALPGDEKGLRFFLPASEVQSFFVPDIEADEVLYLWSPEQQAVYLVNRQTFHSVMLLLLSLLMVLGVGATILRRSRRAAYGVTMGGGLMVLLASLWLKDVLPHGAMFEPVMRYRLSLIQFGLGLGVLMSGLAHLNLIARLAINRNYWTRVIIFADLCLLATGGLWMAEILAPGFAGIVSSELGDIALAVTCATVLLGTIFVPDRR